MDALVSVVIPTYGRTKTLFRAIKSVLVQTFSNLEVLVVDDNANEQKATQIDEICKAFNDIRIKIIRNKRNLGGALARNEGIKAAKGKYIAFLDDDDEYYPQKIEKQVEMFQKSNAKRLGLVYCYCKEIKDEKVNRIYKKDLVGNCVYEAMRDNIAATSQWMCSKKALEDVGLFTDTPCKQDSDLILKLLINGYSIDRVPEILSIFHVGAEHRISTGSHEKRIVGEESLRALCRNHYGLITKEQRIEVEYSFACRLAAHYLATKRLSKFFDALRLILRHPFRHRSLSAYKHILVGY